MRRNNALHANSEPVSMLATADTYTSLNSIIRVAQSQRCGRALRRSKTLWLILVALCASACGPMSGNEATGVIIARRAQVRSSIAVVAADLTEVLRGDAVEILDSITAENGERWLHVRAHDAERTEGWIEARNVMPQELLERSRKLAAEDKDTPAQATGQIRASTNLRSSPDRNGNDNILLKLDNGSVFDIVGWKRVPKPKALEAAESDDAPKAGAVSQGTGRRRAEAQAPKMPEETNELWYKVRLDPSISPAPAGWVYGQSSRVDSAERHHLLSHGPRVCRMA